MDSLVLREGFLLSKSFPTLLTQKSVLRDRGPLRLTEVLLASIVLIQLRRTELFVLVQPHVTGEVGSPPEGLPAAGTFIRLLLRVDPLML